MGYSQKEIAKRLNKKEGSISYHMKMIRELHDNL
jgi:DNA-binding CsgD family transcriptional regulator